MPEPSTRPGASAHGRLSSSSARAALVAGAALALALLLGRPLLVALAAPFLLSWSPARPVTVTGARVTPGLAVVGDRVVLTVAVQVPPGAWLCRVQAWADDGEVRVLRRVVVVRPGARELSVAVRARHRGRVAVRRVRVDTITPTGTLAGQEVGPGVGLGVGLGVGPGVGPEMGLDQRSTVPVLPVGRAPDLDVVLRAARTAAGVHPSRAAGTGEDFRGVRRLHRGDDLRQVNWRASRRTGELLVSERTAERGADVVLLVGTGRASADGLERSVAATAGLLTALLRRGDRVRLAEAGAAARVGSPLTGRAGRVLGTHWLVDVAASGSDVDAALPADHPALRPGAAVVLLASVLDGPAVGLLVALRRRGHPVLLHDATPLRAPGRAPGHVPGPALGRPSGGRRPEDGEEHLARRLVAVRRAQAASGLRARGVPVVFGVPS